MKLAIQNPSPDPVMLNNFDLTRKKVFSFQQSINQNQINLNGNPSGKYMLNVSHHDTVMTKKNYCGIFFLVNFQPFDF